MTNRGTRLKQTGHLPARQHKHGALPRLGCRGFHLVKNASFRRVPRPTSDPTKTLTLRRQFITDINNRFNALKTVIRQSIVDSDCFGLKDKPKNVKEIMALSYKSELAKLSPIKPDGFRFARNDQKVAGFLKWLQEQESLGILELGSTSGRLSKGLDAWSDKYIQSSYQKGLSRARSDLIKNGVDIPSFAEMPGGLNAVFYQPFHADAVGLIYTRTFNELKGVTAAMDQQISRELAAGLTKGAGPYEIARNINDRVDKIGINRARTIARTEVTQTFNTAMINEYASAEAIIKEPIFVQWWTAGDSKVRPAHIERHGVVFKREEALQLIGEPNCRCTLLPFLKSQNLAKGEKLVEQPGFGYEVVSGEKGTTIKKVSGGPTSNIDEAIRAGANNEALNTAVAKDLQKVSGDFKVKHSMQDILGDPDDLASVLTFETKAGDYAGHVRYLMGKGEVYYDDLHFEKIFRGQKLATKTMDLVDHATIKLARKYKTNPLASLEAQDQGRYVWPKLDYKVQNPKDLAKIKKWAKDHGIKGVNTELDFVKLAKYFDEGADGLPESINMVKALKPPKAKPLKKAKKTPAEERAELIKKKEDLVKAQYAGSAAEREAITPLKWNEIIDEKYRVERQIYKTYVDENNLAGMTEMKREKLTSMVRHKGDQKWTKAKWEKFDKSVDWMPYDILQALENSGYSIEIENLTSSLHRAFMSPQGKYVSVAKNNTFDVIAHELAHAVDDMFGGNVGTGFRWKDTAWAKKADADDLDTWLKQRVRRGGYRQGTYSNGDGQYWRDNWIDNYEGRIYSDGSSPEWWSVNVQRYAKYRNSLKEIPEKIAKQKKRAAYYEGLIEEHIEEGTKLAYPTQVKDWETYAKASRDYAKQSVEEIAGKASGWNTVKVRYPELANYIEKAFSGQFMGPI